MNIPVAAGRAGSLFFRKGPPSSHGGLSCESYRLTGNPNSHTRQYTRCRRPAWPSPRTPRENYTYVPARTQTRAAPLQSCAMCVCSVLAPHGCPEPPAPATRLSHHQSQAHDHSRRDASAAVHLSLQSAPIAQAPAPSSGTIPHRSATRPARRFTARRARRHAARAGHRARAPPPDQGCCTTCCRWCSSPACSEHSARVLRCAPAASRLHDADPALHEARAWHAARALRHPFSLLSSLPAHSTEHMQGTQGTCARRAVSAQRCSPHPATVACLT